MCQHPAPNRGDPTSACRVCRSEVRVGTAQCENCDHVVTGDLQVPSIDEVIASVAAPQPVQSGMTEAIVKHIIDLYSQGGQQLYDLHTGQLYREFPEDMLTRASAGDKEKRMQLFTLWWRMHHTPRLVTRWREASAAASQYPGFPDLAAAPLFAATSKEQQSMLLHSVVYTFCLGGEFQIDYLAPKSNWVRRRCAHGQCYETVEEFIDILRKNRGTSQYKNAIDRTLRDPETRRQLEQLTEVLSRRLY